jgi:hypothetical protein
MASGDVIRVGIRSISSTAYYFQVDDTGFITYDSVSGALISAVAYANGDIFAIHTDGYNVKFLVNGYIVSSTSLDVTDPFKCFFYVGSELSVSYTISNIRFYPTGSIGNTGPTGPGGGSGPTTVYGMFVSDQTQSVDVSYPDTIPVAISFSAVVTGSLTSYSTSFPDTQILLPTIGTYKVTMTAQCKRSGGYSNGWIRIWAATNGSSLQYTTRSKSITQPIVTGPPSLNEDVLTADYIIETTGSDEYLQFYMIGDNSDVGILFFDEETGLTPIVPKNPSITVSIFKIA